MKDKAYFSHICVTYLNKFINVHCKRYRYSNIPNYMRIVCNSKYPQAEFRKGLLENAPFFMPCFNESTSGSMSCINRKCHNKDIIEKMPLNLRNALNLNFQSQTFNADFSQMSVDE
ncbi:hypothetical protein HZS_621 [Henneguya salminicola]|nr:hypothetical protein HZS_621 [Henneguya salminicola]